jgi:hypothetical protein
MVGGCASGLGAGRKPRPRGRRGGWRAAFGGSGSAVVDQYHV